MRTSTRCNRGVPRGRTRWARGIKLFLMLFLLGSFLIPSKISAQTIKIDGNPNSVANEWSTSNPSIRRIGDKFNIVNQDTIFAGNEKDFMFAVPDWHWKLGTAKDKNDIANGAAGLVSAVDTVDANGGVHHLTGNFLVFAGDRISNDGDAQIGFWFFQDGTGPVAGGNFAPEKHFTPTPGDLLVLADFTGGGRNANVTVLEFVGTGGTYPNTNGAFNQVNVGAAVAENNAGSGLPIPGGWVFIDKKTGTNTYSTNEFYEGYVDLSIFGAGRHFCPSTFQLETRASQSITATLDDFVNGALAGAPNAPTGGPNSRCGSGSITISATCTGTSVRWYTAASGGSPITTGGIYTVSGSDLTINPLATTTTYYASCYNSTTGCESERVAVVATINPNPTPTAHNLASCETGATGAASFNLNNAIDNNGGGTISFHTSQADANAGTNAIATPTAYSVNVGSPVTIYVRSVSGSCYGTTSFTLTVTDNPDVTAHNLTVCENGSTGQGTFNLNSAIDNADGGTISFYTSQADANAGTNAIATPGSYTAATGTTIYVRSANGSCYGTTSFTLTVTDNPDVTAHNLNVCESGHTGSASVNLNTAIDNADGGTISFYTSLANAQAGTSPIATPTAYSVSVGSPVTIYVRSANGSCYGTTSFTVTVAANATAAAGPDATQCRNSIAGTNTFGTNTFNLSGSGSAGTCSWSVVSNTAGYTVTWGGTGQNSCAPSVSLSGAAVNGGSVTLRLTVTGDCGTATDDVTLTLTALPLIFTVTGTDFCPTAPNTGTITLSGSEVGVNYQLSKDGVVQVGQDKAGTGAPLVWTNLAAGNYSVIGTRLGTSCSTTSGPDNVAENNAPDPSVTNLTSCESGSSGGASFDLNNAVTAADGGTITFYTSLADAQAGSNAVSSSQTVTIAASPKTFWVRSQNATTGCYGIRSFTVSVTDNPDVTAHNLTSCETGTTGAAIFNLNNAIDNADGGTISFYTSLANAQAGTSPIATPSAYSVNVGSPVTIYVRSANGSCYGTTSFTVTVTDNPDVTVQNLSSCETGTTGHATFNLNNGVTNADGGTVTFYTSQADANAATSAIASPTTYSAPVGVTTIWVRDANGTCATVTSFTITVHANPTPTADNKEVCVGATVDLTGSPAGGTWSGDHVTGSTFDASGVAAGNYTVTYTVTDGFGCTGSATATVTVKACGGPLCTYTQGYYGNTNGNSCDADGTGGDPITYQNPVGLITAQLLNGGTLTVGKTGRSVYLPVPDAAITAVRVNNVMPGNSTPKELSVASDVDINSAAFTTAYLNKQGKINNVLLSQTITLGLNMRISSGLSDFALQAGEFATATPDGPCGTKTTKPQCTYSDVYPYGLIGGDTYTYKTITADVITALTNKGYPLTVAGLFMLANDALGNADGTVGTEGDASLSAINAAVDAINTGFDKCRVFVGWDVAHCALTDPNVITLAGASRSSNTGLTSVAQTDKLSVSAYPNPFNDVVKFSIHSKVAGNAQLTIYNMLGQKINTIYNGYVPASKNILVEYKAQKSAQQNLIYILTINGEKVTGKVLNINN